MSKEDVEGGQSSDRLQSEQATKWPQAALYSVAIMIPWRQNSSNA